jgi:hypothetical protein
MQLAGNWVTIRAMRQWISILVFFGVFFAVFAWRRSSLPAQPKPQAPFPGAPLPTEKLQPGAQVTARLVRGGLLIEGDLADPLQEIELARIGQAGAPDEKVAFTGGWTSPVRAIWFFEADDEAKYRVKIRTKLRTLTEVLQRVKVEPLELQRVRMRVKTASSSGSPIIANFSPDGMWLAIGSNASDVKLVSTLGDQTRVDEHLPVAPADFSFSKDGTTLDVYSRADRRIAQYSIEAGKDVQAELNPSNGSQSDLKSGERAKSKDGRWIVKDGTASGSIVLFEGKDETEKIIYTIPHPFAALSRDGRYLAVIDERNLASEPEEADVDVVVLH